MAVSFLGANMGSGALLDFYPHSAGDLLIGVSMGANQIPALPAGSKFSTLYTGTAGTTSGNTIGIRVGYCITPNQIPTETWSGGSWWLTHVYRGAADDVTFDVIASNNSGSLATPAITVREGSWVMRLGAAAGIRATQASDAALTAHTHRAWAGADSPSRSVVSFDTNGPVSGAQPQLSIMVGGAQISGARISLSIEIPEAKPRSSSFFNFF